MGRVGSWCLTAGVWRCGRFPGRNGRIAGGFLGAACGYDRLNKMADGLSGVVPHAWFETIFCSITLLDVAFFFSILLVAPCRVPKCG